MKINKLIINNKMIKFSPDFNLIYSKKNSTGKTTLIRLLLYSMGFFIPSTKGMNFKNIGLSLYLNNNKGYYILRRKLNKVKLIKNKSTILTGNILNHFYDIVSNIFNVKNINLLNNLLGVFYFDQEKGWTLLNRGRVIGRNEFHIQEFINSFISETLENYHAEIKDIRKQNLFYKHLLGLVKLKSNNDINISQNKNFIDDINNKLNALDLCINSLTKRITDLNRIKISNTKFVSMLSNLGLKVHKKIDGHTITIPINRHTLSNFELNEDIINIRINSIKFHLNKYRKKQRTLQKLLNAHGLLDLKNSIRIIQDDISNMNMPISTISSIIKGNKKKINRLKKLVRNILNNTNIINELFYLIMQFAKELGVYEEIDSTKEFIFTKKLKKYSGAILHLIVFAYRLACLKLLERHFDIFPPIILDSPLSGELDIKNAKKMFQLLNRHFSKNQIIVASTNKLEFVHWNKIIHMSHGVFHIR